MSGIPTFTSSPINAAKASGITPQTSLPQPNSASAPTTATATATSSYPSAQPGTPAFPAPTGAAQRYAPPLQPTPTTKTDNYGPAAPQPGAAPTPTSRCVLPPPPKAGEKYQVAAPSQHPPKMKIPPPSTYRGISHSSTTSTSTTESMAYPVGLSSAEVAPRGNLEHPPGYYQDVNASELSGEQHRIREANESALDTGDRAGALDAEGVWDTAKKWAATAGEKIQSAEAEVWRKIGKE